MDMQCIMDQCRAVFDTGKAFHCASGFDRKDDEGKNPATCRYYVEEFVCRGGLSHEKSKFTAATCRECRAQQQGICGAGGTA